MWCKTFKEKFGETVGGRLEALKASIIEFVSNILFKTLELIKDITAISFVDSRLGLREYLRKLRSVGEHS